LTRQGGQVSLSQRIIHEMSSIPINQGSDITAPTPQNTPLTQAPISATLSRPTVPDISEDAEPGEESANVHDAVFGLVQGRLAGLLGKSSGYVEGLPDGAKKTLEALKGVQVKQNELRCGVALSVLPFPQPSRLRSEIGI